MPLRIEVPESVFVTVPVTRVGRAYGLLPIRGILLTPCLSVEVEDEARGLGAVNLDWSSTLSSGMASATSGNGSLLILLIDEAPVRGWKNVDARFGPCCFVRSGSTELLLPFVRNGCAFGKPGSAD